MKVFPMHQVCVWLECHLFARPCVSHSLQLRNAHSRDNSRQRACKHKDLLMFHANSASKVTSMKKCNVRSIVACRMLYTVRNFTSSLRVQWQLASSSRHLFINVTTTTASWCLRTLLVQPKLCLCARLTELIMQFQAQTCA